MLEQSGQAPRASERTLVSAATAARPIVVVTGALVVLQSSQSLDVTKVGFFTVAVLAVAWSVLHAFKTRDSDLVRDARPWLATSVIIAAILGLSLPVAIANATPVGTWIRDAAPYALVAAAPWLALDLGSAVSPRVVTSAIAVVGSLATISFTINWVQRRHMVDLPIDRLVLSSFTLATAFFGLAVARSIWGERDRFAWAVAAAAVVGLLLASGTRTTLALGAIPVVLLAHAVRVRGRSTLRTSLAPAVAPLVVMAVLVLPGMLRALPPPARSPVESPPAPSTVAPGAVVPGASSGLIAVATPMPTVVPTPDNGGRFGTIDEVVAGSDDSLRLRWAQTQAAWNIFAGSPLVGRGLGVPIPWVNTDGRAFADFSADTPLAVLAKFGLFGIVMWAALGIATFATLRRLGNLGRPGRAVQSALLGFATGLVVLTPFGPQLEDKGTGLALILLLGLALAAIRTSDPRLGRPSRG
jgi:hypothetical protein